MLYGRNLIVVFMWSFEDFEVGNVYFKQIMDFGFVFYYDVVVKFFFQWFIILGEVLFSLCYGVICFVRVRKQNDEVIEVLVCMLELMFDDLVVLVCIYEV